MKRVKQPHCWHQLTRSFFGIVSVLVATMMFRCSAGIGPPASGSTSTPNGGVEGNNGHSLLAPSSDTLVTTMTANNPSGIVQGSLGQIVLTDFTKTDGSALDFSVTRTLDGLPAWLSFDSSTRVLSLSSGISKVPPHTSVYSFVYKAIDTSDSSVTTSRTFTFNDLDSGGVPDAVEALKEWPLLNNRVGYLLMTESLVGLYKKLPNMIEPSNTIGAQSLSRDPKNASDDTNDTDGDGTNDAAEISAGTSIWQKTSSGLFSAKVDYSLGSGPLSITAFDCEADGDLDVAATNFTDSNVSTLVNNGSGVFSNRTNYLVGVGPDGIVAAKLNNDSIFDLVVTNNTSNNISVLIGAAGCQFPAAGTNYTAGTTPGAITAADFNGDGEIDVAAANFDGSNVSLFIGNGDGTFDAQVQYSVGTTPFSMIAADCNNNNVADLMVTNRDSNTFSVLKGNGDGTFASQSTVNTGPRPKGIAAGDLNSDGNIDLVVSNSTDRNLAVYLGKGDCTFESPTTYSTTGQPGKGVTLADFDGDGKIDVAVNIGDDGTGTVLSRRKGNGDGTFASETTVSTATDPQETLAADFNVDGCLDLVVPTFVSNNFSVLLNECS